MMARMAFARRLEQPLGDVTGWLLPLQPLRPVRAGAGGRLEWRSSRWPLRRERLFLIEGNSPMGMRLPLSKKAMTARRRNAANRDNPNR